MYTVTVSTQTVSDSLGEENQAQFVSIFQGDDKLLEIMDWRADCGSQTFWSELVAWAQEDFMSKNKLSLDKMSWFFSVEGNAVKCTFYSGSDEQQCSVFLQRAEFKEAILQAA